MHQRYVEIERFADDAFEFLAFDIAAEEGVCHDIGDVWQAHFAYVIEKGLWEQSDGFRHEKTLVRCKAVNHRLFEGGHRGFTRCAVVFDMLAHQYM